MNIKQGKRGKRIDIFIKQNNIRIKKEIANKYSIRKEILIRIILFSNSLEYFCFNKLMKCEKRVV